MKSHAHRAPILEWFLRFAINVAIAIIIMEIVMIWSALESRITSACDPPAPMRCEGSGADRRCRCIPSAWTT